MYTANDNIKLSFSYKVGFSFGGVVSENHSHSEK
ncbi:hypothetical protein JL09_g6269 [Pichia kudriavzevii]|uniref:Uncharacterized protein n=1 Tax=Pichia kudriavzevii TaxID=4909 RepID=A0A099NP65_PICKU|nr:hypothetical protein JL09_g6269 [Pichia kudriavzevii]